MTEDQKKALTDFIQSKPNRAEPDLINEFYKVTPVKNAADIEAEKEITEEMVIKAEKKALLAGYKERR